MQFVTLRIHDPHTLHLSLPGCAQSPFLLAKQSALFLSWPYLSPAEPAVNALGGLPDTQEQSLLFLPISPRCPPLLSTSEDSSRLDKILVSCLESSWGMIFVFCVCLSASGSWVSGCSWGTAPECQATF